MAKPTSTLTFHPRRAEIDHVQPVARAPDELAARIEQLDQRLDQMDARIRVALAWAKSSVTARLQELHGTRCRVWLRSQYRVVAITGS